ncbi:MAG TPA: type II CAAX endopeptidase family protein [Bryobacteraceae bacterium]|nr:type II CAAX endopeptidase family protein [Bryobacteraceae bacterium]
MSDPAGGMNGSPFRPALVPFVEETNRPYPFWGYRDIALFLSMALPSFILALLLMKVFLSVAPWYPRTKATELLPAQFLAYGLWFLSLYLLLHLKYGRPFWPSLAWRVVPGQLRKSALLGLALAFGVAITGGLLKTPQIEMPFEDFLKDPLSIALVAVFAVTLGPLFEELAFRGFFQPLLVRSAGAILGILIAALPFSLLHGPQYAWSWRHILLITLAGCAFGWHRHRTGSTAAAAIMHSAYNLMFVTAYILQGRYATP